MILLSEFPVPLIAELPVNVKFSTLAAIVKVSEDCIVSVPSLADSVTTSLVLSTI